MRPRPARRVAALAVSLAMASSVVASPVEAQENESSFAQFSWGLAAGICTLVYTPVKVAYAATAIPIGGLVWVWSVGDGEMTKRVIERATRGDFVVTPQHLKRERKLVFIDYGADTSDGDDGG